MQQLTKGWFFMKRFALILLSVLLCLAVLSSCGEDGNTSSEASLGESSASSEDVTSAESSDAVSDVTSDVTSGVVSEDESNVSDVSDNTPPHSSYNPDYVVPEFDESKVVFNPDDSGSHIVTGTEQYPEKDYNDKSKLVLKERVHLGITEYIENNDVSEDTLFPIFFAEKGNINKDFKVSEYIASLGAIPMDIHVETEGGYYFWGYATKDMLWKIHMDDRSKSIAILWMPEEHDCCVYPG